jgi:hypothetical protein
VESGCGILLRGGLMTSTLYLLLKNVFYGDSLSQAVSYTQLLKQGYTDLDILQKAIEHKLTKKPKKVRSASVKTKSKKTSSRR